MAQAIMETVFDVLYLTGVITVGILLLRRASSRNLLRMFGWMAVVLCVGDAFHLVPRMFALWTTGLEANAVALGVGKLITSITMTAFYLLLFAIWQERYNAQGRKGLTVTVWALAIARVALCLLPQNDWLAYRPALAFGIWRNIPFVIMGAMLIVLFAVEARRAQDRVFRWMWLAVLLSFAFYIPVVLLGSEIPIIGMLMMPKSLAYVWIVWMGWNLQKKKTGRETA